MNSARSRGNMKRLGKIGMYLNPERRNTTTRNAGILKPGTPEYLNPECRNSSTLNDPFNIHKIAEKTNN